MGLKNLIKNFFYGANRRSREEVVHLMEILREDVLTLKVNSESGLRDLREEFENLRILTSNMEDEIRSLKQELYEKTQEIKDLKVNELHKHIDMSKRDILMAISQTGNFLPEKRVTLVTEYPIAYESNDHLHPLGTKNDNTRAPHFVKKCEEIFSEGVAKKGENLSFMDLGCSGGGLVLDEILKGHFAIGLEGSNYSKKHQRAEWRLLPDNLFTCDICKPFEVQEIATGNIMKFDIITAWELLEHIEEKDISSLLRNIYNHLSDTGYFVGTMSQVLCDIGGVQYHCTVKNYSWWKELFEKNGFIVRENLFSKEDLARGNGNPPNGWILDWGEEDSCFIVAQKNRVE